MPDPTPPRRGLFAWLKGDAPAPSNEPTPVDAWEIEPSTPGKAAVLPDPPSGELDERLVDCGEIARGGMSSIRKVFNKNLQRYEALKALDPRVGNQEQEVLRFLEEAQITGQLDHPNIPAVHEVGVDASGAHYFTMKLVRGRTLEQILKDPKFTLADDRQLFDVLQVFIKVCQSLSFAHARGVVHCDLKPDNVMVGRFGQVYVMDWGIARLTHKPRPSGTDPAFIKTVVGRDRSADDGKVMGTLAFMSPEQAQGRTADIDERSDVFALGAMLYRMLTGRPPYEASNFEKTWHLARDCKVREPEEVASDTLQPGAQPPPPLPWKLCRLAMKAMSADPAQRPQSTAAFQEEVEDFLRGAGRYPVQTFAEGSLIIREGDVGNTAYVIAKGTCRAFKSQGGKKVVLREMRQGEVFGETAILTERPRTASVEAVDDVTLVVVSRQSLEKELESTFYAGHILRELANRFRDVDERSRKADAGASPDARVNELVLTYMNFRSTPADAMSRVCPWNKLRGYLARRLDRPDAEVLGLALRVPNLRINEQADTATLSWAEGPVTGTNKVVDLDPDDGPTELGGQG